LVDLALSMEEIKSIMLKIADTTEKLEVTEHLISIYGDIAASQFNLRTQTEGFKIRFASERDGKEDWKEEMKLLIRENWSDKQKLLYEYAGMKAVRKADFVKFLARKLDISIRRGQQMAIEMCEIGDACILENMMCLTEIK